MLGGLVAWTIAAVPVALVLGRGIRHADRRAATGVLTTADLHSGTSAPVVARSAPAPRARRRAVPLPPIGIALAALAVALETGGYLVRLNDVGGTTGQIMSMDGAYSLPRMFVAAMFAAAAIAAVAGAGRMPGRRAWWMGVALISGAIASVKAGSTVHADAVGALTRGAGDVGALLLSAAAASVVVAGLWFLSRTERRDRRRVLGVLALFAFASVGLSALSSQAASYGRDWLAVATYVEESGEALAGVAFLMAVLIGVAPRLVLPAAWALRRSADAHSLALPEPLAIHRTAREFRS
ncbi:hypothetical protein SAMN05660662_2908 [Blastococcus aurantiacus]|uniref:Uncharacterized protein n=1 Tax=Blastococcus aurantiacus TaxID=1550231 RepID=A0A1G7MSZ7_9ACTN|nr:hypothetical protein SAMN05660662_2908 [Blastococcus aurantiacus]